MEKIEWDEQVLRDLENLHERQIHTIMIANKAAEVAKQAKELHDRSWVVYSLSSESSVQVFHKDLTHSFSANTWINDMLIPCYYSTTDKEDPVGYLDEVDRLAMHKASESLYVAIHGRDESIEDPKTIFTLNWLWQNQKFFCLLTRQELLEMWEKHGQRFPTITVDEGEVITLLSENKK